MSFSGVVLAGGASRRMGRDKALLPVRGRAMVTIAADALAAAGAAEVLVIGGDRRALTGLGLDVRGDRFPGEGPLGALCTAFAEARHEVVAVLACDLPDVHPAGIAAVVDELARSPHLAAVVPVSGTGSAARLEPLHAAYRVSACGPAFVDAFASGARAVQVALQPLAVLTVRLRDERWLANANTPADLERLTPASGDDR